MKDDNVVWPDGFMDIGSKKFSWVWLNRKEFVSFTLEDMKTPTKMFLRWKNYCILKQTQNDKHTEQHSLEKGQTSGKKETE